MNTMFYFYSFARIKSLADRTYILAILLKLLHQCWFSIFANLSLLFRAIP